MSSLRNTVGLPVITTDSADEVGTVGVFIVADQRVEAIAVGDSVVDWSDIHAVGDDAVVLESREALREPHTDRERRMIDESIAFLGMLVLDDRGDELGTVTDVEVDSETGAIRELEVPDNDVDGARLCGIGRYAVVVASERS
jgi:sporulation protein YlmC with PRC-barrel domain